MGERKGTNKYYPPDYNPKAGGLNRFLGTHALRERARKIHLGIIIVRFEMPYNIWCEGCKNHIGMGVRYNAEKKKVGMYYSTPVYEFKMKCHLCDNHFVIKTDPGNLDYVILSGARRQENRWDPTKNEQVVPETKETQKRLFDDSMFKLEHGSQDQNTAESEKPRLVKIFNRNESTWSDHYTSNQKLRESFRKRKYAMIESTDVDKQLLKKSSLDIPLLSEREEDIKYASLLSKVPCRSGTENTELIRKIIIASPALPSSNLTVTREQKALKAMSSSRKSLGIVVKRTSDESTVVRTSDSESAIENTKGESVSDTSEGKRDTLDVSETEKSEDLSRETNDQRLNRTGEVQNVSEIHETESVEKTIEVQNVQKINNDEEGLSPVGNESGESIPNSSLRSSLSLLGEYGSSSNTDSD